MSSISKIAPLILVSAVVLAPAKQCEAGPFSDWLSGRPTTAQYAPTTVGYYPNGTYYGAGFAATYYRYPSSVTTNFRGAPQQSYYAPSSYSNSNYASASYVAPGVPAMTYPYGTTTVARPNWNGYAPRSTTFYRAPRTTYYRNPTTTYYQPPASAPAPSAPTGYTRGPLGLFNWPTYSCGGLTPCRPYNARSNYSPRTAFRPSWQRVPVTYYRPITQTDPVTGQQVQRMVPCTTYRWQIQQSPSLVRRAPSTSSAGCDHCGVPGDGGVVLRGDERDAARDPYYDRSRIIQPGRDGGLIPRDAEIIRDERVDPADQRPRLEGRPPEPTDVGSNTRSPMGRTTANTVTSRADSPVESTRTAKPQQTRKRSNLLPDPEADSYPEPPALLRSGDRTASVGRAPVRVVAYDAVWPTRQKPTVRRASQTRVAKPVAAISAPTKSRSRKLDDRGWKSLGR